MSPFVAEYIGSMLLLLLGNSVVANVLLSKTKGNNSGLIVIAFGWAVAVFVGVYSSANSSGAHLNPAITIGLASIGKFEWSSVPSYILAQFLGAMTGSSLMWLAYKQHFDATEDGDAKLAVFCNSPAIPNVFYNLATEVIGTFVLMLGALLISAPETKLGALDALPVALLVLGIGVSLGGPTGYAINPARDLGPRMMHFLLPIKNKCNSNWGYSWIPVVGPVTGAVIAAFVFQLIQS
ncbi:aquaporin family protein [Lacibacter luteus]|uniref:Aquaporin family protein n=1 Tax=Lacibacter luteus TaxID=2508719 RepID=A0A4Q1CF13_9BACT|nr:MIP/aquaporin family protein [Lacibacter luteus]RXK58484.1 aquaporin family protein [Lacibacter luteus]